MHVVRVKLLPKNPPIAASGLHEAAGTGTGGTRSGFSHVTIGTAPGLVEAAHALTGVLTSTLGAHVVVTKEPSVPLVQVPAATSVGPVVAIRHDTVLYGGDCPSDAGGHTAKG